MKKQWVVLALLVGGVRAASADIFVFKDLPGFEKCLQTDHLVETVKTDKGSQTRFLSAEEIQERCVESAVKVVTAAKNKDTTMEFIQSTKRLSTPSNSLDLIKVFVDQQLAGCNEMAIYEVLLGPLRGPNDGNVYITKDKAVIKQCLKDKDFKKDFLEEKDSPDSYVAANACDILREEKLVKSCKGSK